MAEASSGLRVAQQPVTTTSSAPRRETWRHLLARISHSRSGDSAGVTTARVGALGGGDQGVTSEAELAGVALDLSLV